MLISTESKINKQGYNMGFKGISPLVAVIMLIAFTLIIAGIIAGFVTNFAETQQRAIQYCLDAKVLLQRGIWTLTSSTPHREGNLSLTIYNYGKVPLSFEILLRYSNTTRHPKGIEKYNQTFDVIDGDITLAELEEISDDMQDVTIKSTTCSPPCYECPGAQDFLRYIDIRGLGY
jgi:flagellin-like protein